ncbi:MAG: RNA pyrophosphohydrolase [Rhodospirillales bacterium RIFCSPLOWO2_12_FULL_58_28]|nr:MAG: RNA pyrophosphohydrolase [Rhodospirillales bacterium RIFCSPLOWO2_02_FULL_58_16]OHC79250.1 MAG: RNA pyrophosphohydrolase [Rhodospirillales bacterium RIFCSPLOWO2_12_FULL_58_28]
MTTDKNTVRPKKLPYRKGVGAVLFNAEGKVFVARRLDNPGKYWQMPQGGIDKGEKPRQALIREVAEEIGDIRYKVIAKGSSWIAYDLPDKLIGTVWKGKYRGQKQKWFALKFTGVDGDIDLNATSHPEFSEWKWVDIEELPALAIPFKRELYEKIVSEFRRLASD